MTPFSESAAFKALAVAFSVSLTIAVLVVDRQLSPDPVERPASVGSTTVPVGSDDRVVKSGAEAPVETVTSAAQPQVGSSPDTSAAASARPEPRDDASGRAGDGSTPRDAGPDTSAPPPATSPPSTTSPTASAASQPASSTAPAPPTTGAPPPPPPAPPITQPPPPAPRPTVTAPAPVATAPPLPAPVPAPRPTTPPPPPPAPEVIAPPPTVPTTAPLSSSGSAKDKPCNPNSNAPRCRG